MWGYRTHQWGSDPVWESLPDPVPDRDGVLIEVEACGIGLTVLNSIAGDLADDRATLPRVPGHELVGLVLEAGDDVDPSLIGRRVVAYFYLSCGSCFECRAGREQRCMALKGWVGVHSDGGYAPLCALPARNVIPVSSDLDPVAATVVPDAVATPVHVAAHAGIEASDLVLVIGAGGGVGSHMIQVARLHGAEVVGLDQGEQKLQLIADLGARPLSSASFSELSGRIGGRAPTVVIDLVGSAESIEWGRASLATGGRQVLLTTFRGQSFPLSPRQMVSNELTVLGSRYTTKAEVATAARLVENGDVSPVIGRVVAPEEATQIHIQLRRRTLPGRGAIDWRASRDRAE